MDAWLEATDKQPFSRRPDLRRRRERPKRATCSSAFSSLAIRASSSKSSGLADGFTEPYAASRLN